MAGLLAVTACGTGGGGGTTAGQAAPTISAATGDPLAPAPLPQKEKVVVGITSKAESYAQMLLAEELGEFDKENLDVEIQSVPPNESLLLTAQGKIDVTSSSFTAGTLNLIGQGSPLRWVFPGSYSPEGSQQGFWVNRKVVDPSSAESFKGKKILTSSGDGSPSSYELWRYITGLPGGKEITPTDLIIERFDLAAMPQALQSGAAGVAQLLTPFYVALENDDCCEYLKGAYPTQTQFGWVFSQQMQGRTDVGVAFVRALARTTTTYLQGDYHKDDKVLTALAKTLEQDKGKLAALEPPAFDATFQTAAARNLEAQMFFRARGLLQYEQDLTPDQVYDLRYLKALGFHVS
ncbi:hypothetical protein GCM10009555_061650 [Acrocarpospora macrocephala]|uniref:SsuA/THI5-like domain-containing protein n=1 Tax=Acrocarpospora macrocephala TaxID=150177 RepID=A0A5M3WTZ2_9ACTN|nr:ABC transporter substrate-binding protein [Acrocarpospora macrocephala]GES09608.1 hypothetical protein Amac_032040 [Acrocarpospora macrocephala]